MRHVELLAQSRRDTCPPATVLLIIVVLILLLLLLIIVVIILALISSLKADTHAHGNEGRSASGNYEDTSSSMRTHI
jgi:hypothetical protein